MKLPFAEKLIKMSTVSENELNASNIDDIKLELIHDHNGSLLLADKRLKIVMLKWNGVIDKETARELLSKGAENIEFHDYKKLMINRLELVELETEARIWIKKFLQGRAKRIAPKVNKVAFVNPKSVRGSIFSNMLSSAISLIIPTLKTQKFITEAEASQWLLAI